VGENVFFVIGFEFDGGFFEFPPLLEDSEDGWRNFFKSTGFPQAGQFVLSRLGKISFF
jgi:hypothetical protein